MNANQERRLGWWYFFSKLRTCLSTVRSPIPSKLPVPR